MRLYNNKSNYIYDTAIIGGGPIGSSIAYNLAISTIKSNPHYKIAVIERDHCYKSASSMLSAGGIRQQFSLKENILMSKYSINFIKNISDYLSIDNKQIIDIQFHENGYLYLANDKQRHVLEKNNQIQRDCGVDWIDLLSSNELSNKFPWLNTIDLSSGSYGNKNEGYLDPWLLVHSLKSKAISLGVQYIEGEVISGDLSTTTSTSLSSYNINSINIYNNKTNVHIKLFSNTFVNAAGAWANNLLLSLIKSISNIKSIAQIPVKPRKRCIFTFKCNHHLSPPRSTPLVIDPSGVYFRPEGSNCNLFLTGVSPNERIDKDYTGDVNELNTVDEELFHDIIWPVLANRVIAFEELKVVSSWAGFYEYNTLDQNAIIGVHSEINNLYLCNGFSGHGLQQSPAAGLAISELILYNSFKTIDLSKLSFERIVDNKPIYETGII